MRKKIQKLALLVMALCLIVPITSLAETWKKDSKGWWVQSDDGTYLTNQWYQSPESGLYYYMGADGYMLYDTITPDGFYVNADGVWIDILSNEQLANMRENLNLPILSTGRQFTEEEVMAYEAVFVNWEAQSNENRSILGRESLVDLVQSALLTFTPQEVEEVTDYILNQLPIPESSNSTDRPEGVSEQEWQEWLEFEKELLEASRNGGKSYDVGANGGHAGKPLQGKINIGG
ncbi:hypothetical protein DWX10_27250 [Clostridium sp. AF18-27]|uniref:hypothetical protein n=1 Tax=Enterocloster lavalensis TaxID=460384 RepID=UPI000E552970|nr:hypothetical protein [Enterocloster lavalensis]RHR46055.1 hypothetical protein DWX10_27250 [Clostridium sp. AF18-27]